MLEVQKFIDEHEDWRELLSKEPYCISISDDRVFNRNLVLLKYSQIESDFRLNIVRECRGLILDADTHEIVCYPFYKFFNYGEFNAAEIDWGSAFVSEKLDGSIIKVVRIGSDFLISTNGTIDAFKCKVGNFASPFPTFGELAMEGFKYYGIQRSDFPKYFEEGFTYIFELTSPWNQVIVKWDETKMNLIGVRDNKTLQEIPFYEHHLASMFNTPNIYPIHTIDECVEAAKVLPENNEGYVVCDKNFNRIKVKSPRYVQLHYMASNQNWSAERILEIIRANEVSEYVAYFPMFKIAFDKVNSEYRKFLDGLELFENKMKEFLSVGGKTKKEFAMWVFATDKTFQAFAFKFFDGKVASSKEWLDSLKNVQILGLIGLK